MKKLLFVFLSILLISGCVTYNPDPRPPLINNSDFTDFQPNEYADNGSNNYVKYII